MSAINIPVIRFFDVLLMAAEAEVEVGNSEKAREYVNRVRRRTANPEGWVNHDLNRAYAFDIVENESDLTSSVNASAGDWVVVEEDNTTHVFLGGDASNLDNWNWYEEPNYNIEEYSASEWNSIGPIEAILFERKIELANEGHRFFDLVRWGIAEEVLNDFFEYAEFASSATPPITGNIRVGGQFTPGENEYYPIPQRQIDLSTVDGVPVLKQNPGY